MSELGLISLPHFWIILIGIICLTISIISVTLHKPEKWFGIHRIFAVVGVIFTIIGIFLLMGIYFEISYQMLGITVLIWMIGELIGGIAAYDKKDPKMRKLHVLSGRLVFIAIIVVILFGIIGI